MRLNSLKLTNFMSYANCELNLSQVSSCSIIGPNGSGKSSIIEAILWAMFGFAKLPNKDLISSDKSSMEVELSFELNKKNFHIVRGFGKSMSLKLLEDGVETAQGNILQTESIIKAIGISRDLLLQSIAITQGQLSSFITAFPATRRDLIMEMLDLGRYNSAWDMSKESLLSLNTTIQAHHQTVESLKEQAAKYPPIEDIDKAAKGFQAQMEDYGGKIDALTKRKEELIAQDREARGRLTELELKLTDLSRQSTKAIKDVEDGIQKAELSIKEIDDSSGYLDQFKKNLVILGQELVAVGAALEEIQKLRTQINADHEEIRSMQEKLVVVSKATNTCPLCKNPLDEIQWQAIIATMKTDLNALITKVDTDGRVLKTLKEPRKVELIQKDISSHEGHITRVEVAQESRQEFADLLQVLRDKKVAVEQDFNNQLAHTKQDIENTKAQLNTEIDIIAAKVVELRNEREQCSKSLLEWTSMKKAKDDVETMLTENLEGLEHSRKRLPDTEFIVSALSPTGIPLLIIEHYLPIIKTRTQALLDQMSDGKLRFDISVVETGNKKGIELHAGTSHLRPIKALSGGEQTRVGLAIRLALSQILSDIVGCKFDCLLIDEPEYLDDEGVNQFVQAVSKLSGQFSQIFVMSHLPQIKMAFPQHILVEKVGDESVATVY